jgi:hypothetical protein
MSMQPGAGPAAEDTPTGETTSHVALRGPIQSMWFTAYWSTMT